jgi:AcrR family transcriptional regulator
VARSYDNTKRRAAAERTREGILAACAELVSEGGSLEISMPRVAARAKVSEPTLYRNFPSKQALFDALAHQQFRTITAGLDPRSVPDLQAAVYQVFQRAATIEPLIRWTLATPLATGAARPSRPERVAMLRRALGSDAPDTEVDLHRERLLLLLTSPLVAIYWRDYLGLSVDDAAHTAAWAIGELTATGLTAQARGERNEAD